MHSVNEPGVLSELQHNAYSFNFSKISLWFILQASFFFLFCQCLHFFPFFHCFMIPVQLSQFPTIYRRMCCKFFSLTKKKLQVLRFGHLISFWELIQHLLVNVLLYLNVSLLETYICTYIRNASSKWEQVINRILWDAVLSGMRQILTFLFLFHTCSVTVTFSDNMTMRFQI